MATEQSAHVFISTKNEGSGVGNAVRGSTLGKGPGIRIIQQETEMLGKQVVSLTERCFLERSYGGLVAGLAAGVVLSLRSRGVLQISGEPQIACLYFAVRARIAA